MPCYFRPEPCQPLLLRELPFDLRYRASRQAARSTRSQLLVISLDLIPECRDGLRTLLHDIFRRLCQRIELRRAFAGT